VSPGKDEESGEELVSGPMRDTGRSEFDNFRDLTRRLLAVPKSEVPKKRVKPLPKKTKGN
jgi:hypothetical protein